MPVIKNLWWQPSKNRLVEYKPQQKGFEMWKGLDISNIIRLYLGNYMLKTLKYGLSKWQKSLHENVVHTNGHCTLSRRYLAICRTDLLTKVPKMYIACNKTNFNQLGISRLLTLVSALPVDFSLSLVRMLYYEYCNILIFICQQWRIRFVMLSEGLLH